MPKLKHKSILYARIIILVQYRIGTGIHCFKKSDFNLAPTEDSAGPASKKRRQEDTGTGTKIVI